VRANTARRSPSVLVLGAGLSGLYAALLLERAGVTVTVLEGRDRVGGRVHILLPLLEWRQP
jgi:monoamine oxidase